MVEAMNSKEAVQEYQCPGCEGSFPSCFSKSEHSCSCDKHCPGTILFGSGTIFLGLPRGFNRLGPIDNEYFKIEIFEAWSDEFNEFNIPVWKYKDEHGNTIVRGLRPRLNQPFLHIFLGDYMDKINCFEVTEDLRKTMD